MSSTRMFTSPLFLGFDHLEQMLERAAKSPADGYPPYNIEQTHPTGLRITLAVAGFTMGDLQITQEDNQLVVRGRQADDPQGRVYLHRGIAARQFQRAFVMSLRPAACRVLVHRGLRFDIGAAGPLGDMAVNTTLKDFQAEDGLEQDLTQDDVDIRKLTQAQLMQLGMSQLAYVKPVWMDGETAFAIFAADGSPMAVAADCDLAVAAIVQHEMVPALVH